jgi:tellurite methyltransferase
MSAEERHRWDQRYANETSRRESPSAHLGWLAAAAQHGKNPLALDLACGTGRHTNVLRQLGYRVVAADVSIVALRIVAAEFGIAGPVLPVLIDVDTWPFADGCFDVVVQVNFLSRDALARIGDSIRPGGWLLIDTHAGPRPAESAGPSDPAHRLGFGELRRRFSTWRILRLEETRSGGGRAAMLAQKPYPPRAAR